MPAPNRCGRCPDGGETVHPFVAPFERTDLHAGLAFGVAVSVVWLGLARRRGTPVIGAAFTVGGIGGAWVAVARPPNGLLSGLALLAIAGAVAHRRRWSATMLGIAALPGALLIGARPGLPGATWLRVALVLFTTVGAALTGDFDTRHEAVTPVILVLLCAALYTITPDTELALVLLGSALGVVAMGRPIGRATVLASAPLACGVLGWVIAVEGHTRPGAVVAAMACLGVLVAEPLARRLAPDGPNVGTVALLGAQVATVALLHTAGHRHDTAPVVADAIAVILATAVSLTLVATVRARPRT